MRASQPLPDVLFPLAQVGSHDLTLVNLHLAALTLPGGENPSKNHSDGHRWASFTQTLQESLKGRKPAFSPVVAAPTSAGQAEDADPERLSRPSAARPAH